MYLNTTTLNKKIKKTKSKRKFSPIAHDNEDSDMVDDQDDDLTIYSDKNHIYFNTDVTVESCARLIYYINKVSEYVILTRFSLKIDEIPIYLHLSSYGGCVASALRVVDVIKASKIPIYSVIEGYCASATTIMSVVCVKKFIRPNAFMLIHQLSSTIWGTLTNINDEVKCCKKMMKIIISIYLENTKIPKEELKDILEHDITWNSKQCIKKGLADELFQ
jgi:ATP-dependent protease ClpP protease subunit